MFLLNLNKINTVVLTLDEKRTISNPYYIFKVTFDQTGESKFFYAEDKSTNKSRYDLFEIELISGGTENLTGNTPSVILQPEGLWSYTVYESSAITFTNLVNIVEEGRFYLLDANRTPVNSVYDNQPKQKYYYKN